MSEQLLRFNNRCIDQVLNFYLKFYPIPKNDETYVHITKHAFFSIVGVAIMVILMFAQLVGLINYNFSYFVLCMRSMFSLLNLAQGLSPNVNFTVEMKNWYIKLAVIIDAILIFTTLYVLIPVATYNMFFNIFSVQTTLSLMSLIKSNILIGILSNLQTCLIPFMLLIGTLYMCSLLYFAIIELHLLMFSIVVSTMSETARTSWENSIKTPIVWLYKFIHIPCSHFVFKTITYINNLNNDNIFSHIQIEQIRELLTGEHLQLYITPTHSSVSTHVPLYTDVSPIPSQSSVGTSILFSDDDNLAGNHYSYLDHINNSEPYILTEDFTCSICHHETHVVDHNTNIELNSITSDVTTEEDVHQLSNTNISVQSSDRGDHIRLTCSHIFHRNCIRQSVNSGLYTCPNCRTNII